MNATMTIGAAASTVGLSAKAVRLYEARGCSLQRNEHQPATGPTPRPI